MYVPITRKIIFSYDVVFDEMFSSALAYMSQPYTGAIAMHPALSYIPCATSSKKQTGYGIMFAHFEEGNLVSETCNDVESSDESDEDSIMPRLIMEEEMDVMDSVDESDDEPMSMEM